MHFFKIIVDTRKRESFGCQDNTLFKFVTIHASVTNIPEYSFFRNTALETLVLPETVKHIGARSFCECSLRSIIIPESVQHIGQYAFACNRSLRSIIIPKNVKRIDESAFANCTSLESIVFNCKGLKDLDEGMLAGCKNLKSVVLNNGLELIAEECFSGYLRLGSIKIPKSVTEIQRMAFLDCKSLSYILLPDDAEIAEDDFRHIFGENNANAFENCKKLERIASSKRMEIR